MKYIIVAILATAGLVAGAWNWINYFKVQSQGTVPQVQAVRPAPNPQIAAIEQQMRSNQTPAAAPARIDSLQQGKKFEFPDTLGRNPFLSPEEIELIASGKFVDDAPPPVDLAALPEIKVTALLQENVSGDYLALIGGKAYRKGEMIGQEQVVEITGTSVVLEQSGRRRTLNIKSPEADKGVSIEMRNN